MKNLQSIWGFKSTLCLLIGIAIFSSCKKDDSSVDEYRYRRYLQIKKPTTTTTTTTGTGTTTTGSGTTGTGTTTTGTGTTTTTGNTSSTRANLITETTFEESDPFSEWHNTQHCCSYSINKSSEIPARAGSNSMRIELFKTDATTAASKRAELNENTSEPVNAERWIGVSYYFPSATFAQDKDAELIMQFHTEAPSGSPPFELDVNNGKFIFLQAINPNGGATTASSNFKITTIGSVVYDKWTDMVWHYKQSSGSDGLIEGWINGTKVYSQSGPNTFAAYTNYFKIGINKWTWMPGASYGGNQTHRLFYIDELRFGSEKATYNDVVPG